MAAKVDPILVQIATKLKSSQDDAQRNYASTIFTLTKSLETSNHNLEEFTTFIAETYDILIKGDSSKRSSILRAVRYCLTSKDAVKVMMEQQLHWAVVASLEKDGDCAVERMQALKVMEKVQQVASDIYPLAFARSLVAVANYKEDNFRKICIDSLRDLALSNPGLVAAVDGFAPLMDAVLEPITQPMADSILLTIIYLLNDPITRSIVASGIDLRSILSPFTDLDSAESELAPKWRASKAALVLLMRSWVGIVQLSSDDMAWPTLIRMLRDPKVPLATQEIILETISEIFEPVMSKVKQTSRGFKQQSWNNSEETQFSNNMNFVTSGGSGKHSNGSPGSTEKKSRPLSDKIPSNPRSQGYRPASNSDAGTAGKGFATRASDVSFDIYGNSNNTPSTPNKKESFRSSFAWASPPPAMTSSTTSGNTSTANALNVEGLISPSGHRKTFSMPNFFAPNAKLKGQAAQAAQVGQAAQPAPTKKSNSGSSLAGMGGTSQSSSNSNAGRASDDTNAGQSAGIAGGHHGEMSTLLKLFQLRKRRGSKTGNNPRSDSPSAVSMGSLSNTELRLAGFFNEQEAQMDPIYNLMDNYTALLCCVFLHSNVIESLYFLGINGPNLIAQKSRRLMVNFLRTMAYIFPEDMCSQLLTIPSLLEFAAAVSSCRSTKRAHKSSQILISLAEAFTLMPYKQISGNHISGLSSMAPKRPSLHSANSGGGNGKLPSAITSPSVTARANLPPLNIQTIYELAEEIKISSFSTISSGESTVDGTSSVVAGINGTSTAVEVLNNLRNNLTPEIDKNDFIRQMDLSRVIGKEGKEPFKWDWITICDMLEYSFFNSSRLSEALKTKWVRRVSGFYRCSVEEKGYFANLDWEPIHLQYLECACNMYSVLLKDEAGMNFLTSDRRGMLFNEIAHEIENLTVAAASTNVTAQSAALSKNVFRLYSCQCTMAREFFTLLGRIVHNTGSKHLVSGTSIFPNLLKLGQYRSLDYASRLVLTSLSFTDGGIMSRQLLQQWTQKSGCTLELRAYAHALLRILLRSGAGLEAFTWRVDAVTSQLESPRALHTPSLYKALQEAVHDKSNLRAIIAKRPKLNEEPAAQRTLLRFLCISEGIDFLSCDKNNERVDCEDPRIEQTWLGASLTDWKTKKCETYVDDVDRVLTMAFAQCDKKICTTSADPVLQNADGFDPIPIQTMEFLSELVTRNGSNYDDVTATVNRTVKLANGDAHSSSENNWYNRDPNANLLVDLHGLVRVPWNIEVKITNASSTGGVLNGFSSFASSGTAAASTTVMQQSPTGEYLRIDSFLDASHLPSPLCYETTSDQTNLIKVRGIVLDNRGFPTGHPVPYTKVVSSTLLAGVCPVTRSGRALAPGEVKVQRRKTTVSEGAYEAVSRMSAITPSNASLAESPLPNGANAYDLPVSFHLDGSYDWTNCKANHRQNNITELPDGQFSVTVPGEPVVLVFSRRSPATPMNVTSGRAGRMGSSALQPIAENASRPPSGTISPNNRDAGRSGAVVWLVEVQYFFRLETGYAIFVPMPPHIYGELTRTLEGCEIIAKRKIVSELLGKAHHLVNVCTQIPLSSSRHSSPEHIQSAKDSIAQAYRELQGTLWALGHIGSNEMGCALIFEADRKFVGWCIENTCSSPYYSLRGTFFYVLGLISRTIQGSRKLLKYNWDCAPRNTNSAVAFPLRASSLFRPSSSGMGSPNHASSPRASVVPTSPAPPTSPHNKTPFAVPPYSSPTVGGVAGGMSTLSIAPPAFSRNPTSPISPGALGVMSPVRLNTLPEDVLSELHVFSRVPTSAVKNMEIEVLHIIAKLPGVIVYRECKARLDHIKREHPAIFARRSLYVQVHRMLESYTFKLTARRDVLALFTDDAKMRA